MPLGETENGVDWNALVPGRLMRAFRTSNACGRILLQASSVEQLTADVCRALVEVGGYKLAWIGFIDKETPELVRRAAASGVNAERSLASGPRAGCPLFTRALREKRMIAVANVAEDLDAIHWRRMALDHGLRSCLVIPLADKDTALGVLSVFADARTPLDAVDESLCAALCEDLVSDIQALNTGSGRSRIEMDLLQSERELKRSREHLDQAQRIGGLGSMEFDFLTGKTYWSEGFYQLIGADSSRVAPSDEVVIGSTHPEDRNIVRSAIELARDGKEVPAIEYRIARPDGNILWVRRRQAFVRSEDGRPTAVAVTLQDITERKQFETELSEREIELLHSRENLASAQRIGRIGSIVIDTGTGEARWSDELFALLGRNPATDPSGTEELIAMAHPEDREAFAQRWAQWRAGGVAEPGEFRLIPKSGETRWFHVRADLRATDATMPTNKIVILQDITDRRRVLEEHAALERQLMQAQKMEAVGNLTGGVAHDFNNLLTVILGHLDLIEGRLGENSDLHDWIRVCKNAIGRGARLTRSMLAFARQQPLRPIPVDAGAVMQETCDILGRTLGEGIAIGVERQAGLWICEADPSQLQNALLNLAINARDAMPAGGRLLFEARNASLDRTYAANHSWVAAGDYVVLSVTDTGTGMTPAVLGRAFEPFFTTKETGKGSGLGLSMVYGFVKQSGGYVNIYSEIGKGTVVKMYLPRSRAQVSTEPVKLGDKPAFGGNEKILVVEDDEDMRALTVTVLRRLGYEVIAAGDADTASELLLAHPDVALLLTDITLPNGIDGRALAMRERNRWPNLRVLYMSGYSEHAVMHDRRLDPTIRLLEKPFNTDELARQVRAALAGQPQPIVSPA